MVGSMYDRGHAWQRAVCGEGVHGGEAGVAGGRISGVHGRGCVVEGVRGRRDGHCSRRYASY